VRPTELLDAAGAADRLTVAAAEGSIGPLGDRPLVVVALDGTDTEPLEAIAGVLPAVVVGLGRPQDGAPDLDVLLTDEPDPPAPWVSTTGPGDLDALVTAVDQSPLAAVTLVQLLRMGRTLAVPERLVAESVAYGLLQAGPQYQTWLRAHQDSRGRGEPDRDTGPAVLVERHGATLTVTLDRPHVHNAFHLALRDGLVEALQLAALDPTVASVDLRGNGPSFCSGGDLTEFGTVPDPVTGHLVRTTRSAALALWRVADRVTVHLHGACVGAGIELAALAGQVVAHPDSRLRLPEVGFGLVPGAGGTASVPLRIGRARTAWLALSGTTLDAATALRWGLVDALDG